MHQCAREGCDRLFTRAGGSGGGSRQRFCSKACQPHMASKKVWVDKQCPTCGDVFSTWRTFQKYCSKVCGEVAKGSRLPEPLPERVCAFCGDAYQPMFRHQQCCSELCGKRRWKQQAKAEGKLKPQPWDDKRRDNYHRRRALKLAASTGEPVLRDVIAARDGHKCGLCGLDVVMTVQWPNPQSPSIDHIIPLSRGGSHDPSNCQLAHLECNTSKGNRLAEAA